MQRLYLTLIMSIASFCSLKAQTLLHYWNFNTTSSYSNFIAPTSSIINGAALDTQLFTGGNSLIDYPNGTGQGFDVNNYNARNNDVSGNHLRFNNPIYGALIFSLPTTGYKNLILNYATMRSGSGAYLQYISYTTDGSNYIAFDTIIPGTAPGLTTLDFSSISSIDNNANFKVKIQFGQGGGGTAGNNRIDNLTLEGEQDIPASLIHYWNFNTSSSYSALITPSATLVNGAALDTQMFSGGSSLIDFANGTGQGFDVNNYNARNNDASGTHLRFNNPIYGALIFSLPSTGYKDLILTYAGMRSGSGAHYQFIHYTTDGSNYTFFDTIIPGTAPTLYSLDFSSISAANNNPNFKIKITFGQGGGGTAGNNRIDNFSLEGFSLSGNDVNPPSLAFDPKDNEINVATNKTLSIEFNENIRLENNDAFNNNSIDTVLVLKLNGPTGNDVAFDATLNGKIISIQPNSALLNNQQYYLAIKKNVIEDLSDNVIDSVFKTSFKTISLQTVFSPGDLVPIAYRMNATATDDEISLLTTVNILEGTIIHMTDAKFTDNSTPQCSGGLSWTAPAGGVSAGTVISVKNDVPSVNVGALSSSAFGLSSGGDQFLVYTGSPANASHITALSSNLWLLNNTTCSGSNSKLPTGLTDGKSSIQLSAANGNVTGNTANAYYNGPQNLPYSQLRDSILNPMYWVGSASGTSPQTWPNWAFDGPPVVLSAKVLTQTSIQVVFNKDLDNTSATNTTNFTGITGLNSISRSNNGNKADTLVLSYSTPFSSSTSYSLTVNNVKDYQMVNMFSPYTFNFTYNTKIRFEKNFVVLNENSGTYVLKLLVENPSTANIDLKVKTGTFSTAVAGSDFTLSNQTVNVSGASSAININIPVQDDSDAEQDEYFVLELTNASGLSIDGKSFATIYIKDNDKKAKTANKEIELNHIKSFKPDSSGSTCEIVAYDSISKRIFMTSAIEDRLDIADFSNPASIKMIKSIDMSVYGGITSVAIKNGIIAVASPNINEQLDGKVVFFNSNGDYLKDVTVGALPDMIIFSPDGKLVLTANEGQPNSNYSVDPEGSVSIIDISAGISGLTQSKVNTLLFTAYNSQQSTLIASGVRKLKSSSTMSQDFEPEYITISSDSKTAWVTLQENNAIAEINLVNQNYASVWAMGTKDWMASGNGFDASDNNQNVLLSSWPVKSFFISDAVLSFKKNGVNYLLTANEGDEKEYDNLNERTTVGAVTYILDSAKYPNASVLKETFNLGRLRVTNLNGDTDSDGDIDQIYSLGTRSFSIFNADNKSLIFDSKDDFEQFTSKDTSINALFNADNEGNAVKGRSRAKGPEPEGACLATINGRMYGFIGLERVGGVMVYNISDPSAPTFVDYKNTRSKTAYTGDHGPEGIIYLSDKQSPDGKHYILEANELSGTISVYEVKINTSPVSVDAVTTRSESLFVYPNPANGNELFFSSSISGEVINVMGQSVGTVVTSDQLDIRNLENGIYFIQTDSGILLKFIINR